MYLIIAQALVSIALIVIIMFQLRGGGLGSIFGQADSVYRTRRGLEKTLLNLTIVLTVAFIILALLVVTSHQ